MKKEYDVIIVGGGVGGIVCALYLLKKGISVLVVERHYRAGGYCTSFSRNGFKFDAAVHYLKGCKKGFPIGNLINDFNLLDKMSFNKIDPSDTLIAPDFEISIHNNLNATIESFVRNFPKEKNNIEKFIRFITELNVLEMLKHTRGKSFSDVLVNFFNNKKIIAIFDMYLGNLGLPAKSVSATSACVFYRELFLDSGYYPKGGMQTFVDALVNTLREYGGDFLLSSTVEKIRIKNQKTTEVLLNTGDSFISKAVVANCDMNLLYGEIIDDELVANEKKIAHELTPTVSAFIVYLGLNISLKEKLKNKGSIWFCPSYDVEAYYDDIKEGRLFSKNKYVIMDFPSFFDPSMAPKNGEALTLFIGAPFLSREYWDETRQSLEKEVIERAAAVTGPLSKNIVFSATATPYTLYDFTLNTRGAMYGWASTISQVEQSPMLQRSKIKNLFFAGHWSNQGLGWGGISMVTYSGFNAAKQAIKYLRRGL